MDIKRILKNPSIAGELNPNWKGGVSRDPYPFYWKNVREYVIHRDNARCRNPVCWGVSLRLNVHHIDYNKNHCFLENLITLCVSCNARANFDREHWKLLYMGLMQHIVNLEDGGLERIF